MPPELKLSHAVVAVVPAEGSAAAVAAAAAAAGAGMGAGALRLPQFSTQAQVKRALDAAPHRVLTLSSAVDAFCSFDDAATNQQFDHVMVRMICDSGQGSEDGPGLGLWKPRRSLHPSHIVRFTTYCRRQCACYPGVPTK